MVATVQTASQPKRLAALKGAGFELLIIDEAHHSTADSYINVFYNLGIITEGQISGRNAVLIPESREGEGGKGQVSPAEAQGGGDQASVTHAVQGGDGVQSGHVGLQAVGQQRGKRVGRPRNKEIEQGGAQGSAEGSQGSSSAAPKAGGDAASAVQMGGVQAGQRRLLLGVTATPYRRCAGLYFLACVVSAWLVPAWLV